MKKISPKTSVFEKICIIVPILFFIFRVFQVLIRNNTETAGFFSLYFYSTFSRKLRVLSFFG